MRVWHFYDFSTIYCEFLNIQSITNINKIPKKEEKTLGPEAAQLTWTSGHDSPGGVGAAQPAAQARVKARTTQRTGSGPGEGATRAA